MKLPLKINQIACNCSNFKGNKICYIINRGESDEVKVQVTISFFDRFMISKKIVDDSNSFVHGLKLVQVSDGKYAYVRQLDHQLLPYRYDIATSFNKYGFAMVAKYGRVSWIDSSFHVLTTYGEVIKQGIHGESFEGFEEVNDFSTGEIPLSKVYDGRHIYGSVSYFGTDGKIKEFHDETNHGLSYISFKNGTNFGKNGIALTEDKILFAEGYYHESEDISCILNPDEFVNQLNEDASISGPSLVKSIFRK